MADLRIRKKEPPRRTSWGTGDLLRAAVVFAGVYMGLQLLWFAHVILFVAFLGVLFGVALSAGVDRLEERNVPRGVGASAIVLAIFGLLVLSGAVMAPTVREQTEELRVQLPQAVDRAENWLDSRDGGLLRLFIRPDEGEDSDEEPDDEGEEDRGGDASAEEPAVPGDGPGRAGSGAGIEGADPNAAPQEVPVPAAEEENGPPPSETLRQRVVEQLGDLGQHLFAFLTSTVAVLGSILLILFVAIYIAVDPETYRRGFLYLVPRRGREKAANVMSEVSLMLRRWLMTQLVAMVLVGTATTIALVILDVRAALALGILAALLEFIPIFGPIIAAVPAIAMGFLESPQMALYVLIVYVVIQQIESQLLVPLLMKEGVDIPPVLTVLAQALMVLVFGFVGLLVAVPLVAAAIVVVKVLYVQDVVGEQVVLPREAYDQA